MPGTATAAAAPAMVMTTSPKVDAALLSRCLSLLVQASFLLQQASSFPLLFSPAGLLFSPAFAVAVVACVSGVS